MYKKLFFLISVVLVLSLSDYALAQDGVIPASGAPVIDGFRDPIDPNWLVSDEHKMLNISVNQDNPPSDDADLSCSWLGIWDTEYLYIFVDVNDDSLWNDSPSSYEDDSAEIMIDIGNDDMGLGEEPNEYGADDFQYRISWDATTPTIEEYYHPGSTAGVEYKLLTKPGNLGYTLEIKFPWSTLDVDDRGISVNDEMGLEVQVNDDDDGAARERQVAWINTENVAWQDPSTFGTVILAAGLQACYPTPIDKAKDVFVDEVKWVAGLHAASHDIFLDTNEAWVTGRNDLCDINDSCTDPCYPVPGLLPETTYYWVIDEVNVAGPAPGAWAGNVWEFKTAPLKAHSPDPYDGAQLVDLDADIFWGVGYYADGHKVYFDTSETLVDSKSTQCDINGVSCADPCYPLPTLEKNTTYYWAIDEVNDTGPVWSGDTWEFTTVPEPGIGSILCEVWRNIDGSEVNDLRNDPRYPDSPDSNSTVTSFEDPTGGDIYGTRMHGWLYIYPGDTNDYTFWIASNEQSELWLSTDDNPENATKIASVSIYTDQRSWDEYDEQQSKPITYLAGGNMYYIMALHKEEVAQDHMSVGWSTTTDPNDVEIIPGQNLIPFIQKKPFRPTPRDGATDVRSAPILSWAPGMYAVKNDVYFGTDRDVVKDASRTNDPCGVLVEPNIPSVSPTTTYDIIADIGTELAFDTTYYWRVDDVNEFESPYIWKGQVWEFTTGKYHVVEDFEEYLTTANLKTVWKAHSDIKASREIECGLEHSGLQAMAIEYDNTSSQSEAYVDVNGIDNIVGKNWRLQDVKALSLWLHGIPDLVGSYTGSDPYTLEGDGSGIDDTNYDVFYYLYTKKDGQMTGQVTARVDSIDNTDPSAMAGVMLRDTLDPGSIYAATVMTPDGRVVFMVRPGPGATSAVKATVSGITLPHWIRINRGPTLTTAEHANEVNEALGEWSLIATHSGPIGPPPLYLGLCVTSNSYGEMCEAEFFNVQMRCPIATPISDPTTEKDIGDYVDNDLQPMYVVLQDSDGNDGIVYYENKNANVTRTADWTEWRIDMNEFITQDVDMCDVNTMYIGVGDKDTPSSGDGTVYIDDIALYAAAFYEPNCPPLPADLVRDGEVDYDDLKMITDNWLIHDYEVTPKKPDANCLVAWYRLEQDPCDSANGFDANEYGINTADYVTDKKEGTWALDLKGDANYIEADYVAADYGIQGNNHRTITAWAKTRTFDDEFRGLYEIGGQEERGQDFSMLTSGDEPNVWRANHEGGAPGWDIDFAYPSQNKWVHLAHTYDGTTVRVYADGNAVAERVLDLNTTNLKNFSIGQWTSWGDYYFDGIVDDVRIYDCALSQANAAYIARYPDVNAFTQPLELLLTPQNLAIDLFVKDPNMINFRDVAELGKHWGETQVWPTW